MEGEVRRRVTDLVLWIFGIVPTEEGPCPLPPLAMNVLGPGRVRFVGEDGDAGLEASGGRRTL